VFRFLALLLWLDLNFPSQLRALDFQRRMLCIFHFAPTISCRCACLTYENATSFKDLGNN
jgi:hypothetical protein